MSLIYGLKTQDGVYLATDTRLTTKLPSGLINIEDDFGKFHTFSKFMYVVAAGDAGLASFLIEKIQNSELREMPFVNFRKKISAFVRTESGFYPNIANASSVVFIFSGSDPSKKEEIHMDNLVEYTEMMQGNSRRPVSQKITKPLFDAMLRAAEAGEERKVLELDSPYIGLFSLEISFSEGLNIKLSDAGWSTYLMYGPNKLTYKNAPPKLVVDLDLSARPEGMEKPECVANNCLKLVSFFFSEMVPKHQLHTVGGSVIVFFVTEHGAIFPTGEIASRKADGSIGRNLSTVIVNDGRICTKIGDDYKPLRMLIDFFDSNGNLSLASI